MPVIQSVIALMTPYSKIFVDVPDSFVEGVHFEKWLPQNIIVLNFNLNQLEFQFLSIRILVARSFKLSSHLKVFSANNNLGVTCALQ